MTAPHENPPITGEKRAACLEAWPEAENGTYDEVSPDTRSLRRLRGWPNEGHSGRYWTTLGVRPPGPS